MKQLYITLFVSVWQTLLCAQNLVPNPSFESHNTLLDGFTPCKYAEKFANLGNDWYNPNKATPDWWGNENMEALSANSNFFFLSNTAHTGNNCIGLATNSNISPKWCEYVQTKLKQPLQKGHYYKAALWLSADGGAYRTIPNLGFLFTNNKYTWTTVTPSNTCPQVKLNDTPLKYQKWQKLESVFRADSNLNYLTLGIFSVPQDSFAIKNEVYALLDDISVEEINAQEYNNWEPALADRAISAKDNIKIKNIQFEMNSAVLLAKSTETLKDIIGLLKNNPTLTIEIQGHTDNKNTDMYNLELSQNRAKTVYDYLISKGSNSAQISYKGYGKTMPIAENTTENGRAQNRRVSIYILNIQTAQDVYALACQYSLKNELDSSFYYLQLAHKLGITDMIQLFDPDLQNLKQDKTKWAKVENICRIAQQRTIPRQIIDKGLIYGLHTIWYEDQVLRNPQQFLRPLKKIDYAYPLLNDAQMIAQNQIHRKYIDKNIDISQLDKNLLLDIKGCEAIWLVVQHSNDVAYMQKYLPLFDKYTKTRPKRIWMLAYLQDRLLLLQGKSQLYGTQFIEKTKELAPIADPETLNQRLVQIGMAPFSEEEITEIIKNNKK